MSSRPEDILQLIEITGLSESEAESLLQMHDFNIEQAINYHLEAASDCQAQAEPRNDCTSGLNNKGASNGNVGDSLTEGADFVRAPIPSKREQLVMPEDDNFRFRKRRVSTFSVCPLRNFAREAEIQEQEINTYLDSGSLTGYSSSYVNRELAGTDLSSSCSEDTVERNRKITEDASYSNRNLLTKRARLEDLFRPPVDILFWGTFRTVRDYASLKNRWLIVNLQDNSEFKSQVINRDIWSDPILKELVQKYFVLWQVSVENPEGLRFKTFYKVESMPYICIIDPRTGEEKQAFEVVTSHTFTSDLNEYLSTNSYSFEAFERKSPGCSRLPPSSTVTKFTDLLAEEEESRTNKSELLSPTASRISKSATELSEEDQIALAIKNSLNSNSKQNENEDSDENEDVIVLSDSEEEICAYKNFLGSKDDPMTILQIRLPNGERTTVEWPLSTKLHAIRLYVQLKYPEHTKEPYKIICAFPRQNILELGKGMSLADASLHPRAILHLHPDV